WRARPRVLWAAYALISLALALLPFALAQVGTTWVRITNYAILYVLLALGLNIVVGFAGLLDLGYIAFYAVGAYTYALLASPHFNLHLPFWVILPIGAAIAALFGVLLGAPTLKLRGDYLAIVTLGFGEIVRLFLNNLSQPVNVTSGPQGIARIDPFRIGEFSFSSFQRIGGLAGGMFAAIQAFISPESFILVESVMVVSMVVLGGMGNIWGVILGALLLSFTPEILRWTVEPVQHALFGRSLIEPEVIRML